MSKVLQSEIKIKSESKGNDLLNSLRELWKLSERFKTVSVERAKEIKNGINETNLQLSDLETQLIHNRALGNETSKSNVEAKETELLTKLTLLRQRQENLQNEGDYVISQKLSALMPSIIEAEKESNAYSKEKEKEIAEIDLKIGELKEERLKLYNKSHPYRECGYIIETLEKVAKLPRSTINHAIMESKGLNKKVNPYFGGIDNVWIKR